MNRRKLFALTAIFLFLVPPAMAEQRTVTLAVEKMHCALCPVTVRKAIEKVDGVSEVTVDFDTKTASVVYDDAIATVEKIAAASTNVGYPAHPVKQ